MDSPEIDKPPSPWPLLLTCYSIPPGILIGAIFLSDEIHGFEKSMNFAFWTLLLMLATIIVAAFASAIKIGKGDHFLMKLTVFIYTVLAQIVPYIVLYSILALAK